jgi:hypothetical protein
MSASLMRTCRQAGARNQKSNPLASATVSLRQLDKAFDGRALGGVMPLTAAPDRNGPELASEQGCEHVHMPLLAEQSEVGSVDEGRAVASSAIGRD